LRDSKLYTAGGTIQVGSAPSQVVNSANPGVRLDATGLYGYGTVGNTFALYTDGRPPYISSGTIKEMVFEAYTAGVFRTGSAVATDGGVQVDRSGIFAYSQTGVLKFQVDAATGLLTATDGVFSGSVSASTISSSSISGGTIDGSKFTVAGGTVVIDSSGPVFRAGTVHTLGDSAADIRWELGPGTVITYIKTEYDDDENILSLVAHDAGGRSGRAQVVTTDTSMVMTDGYIYFTTGGTGIVQFQSQGQFNVLSDFDCSGTVVAQTKVETPAINLNSSASLTSGPGSPSSGLGVNGDIYFDSTKVGTPFFYRKNSGSWVAYL
jgi:hypothetical protein